MLQIHAGSGKCIFGCGLALALILLLPPGSAQAQGETVLYSFQGGNDGAYPYAGLLMDKSGNLYGSTYWGGGSGCDDKLGCGTIFELPAGGSETVIHPFAGRPKDGAWPAAAVIADKAGNLYGTTYEGGHDNTGTVFEISSGGTESLLYPFTGSSGGYPVAPLIADAKGNLYGTTSAGGADNAGTVFAIAAGGTETVLYSFGSGTDGAEPLGGLLADKAGNLYGTTFAGGTRNAGTIFEIAPGGTETVLYSFTGKADGGYPTAGLIADKSGNLYGTTESGGEGRVGTIFEYAAGGAESVLHAFSEKEGDGEYPWASLVMDKAGNLYGTTAGGGKYNAGAVFEVSPQGAETLVYSFAGGSDGADPVAPLIMDKAGNLYGTTQMGGTGTACENGCGTIFEIAK